MKRLQPKRRKEELAYIPSLVGRWTSRAQDLEPYNPGAAHAWRSAARELDAEYVSLDEEVLSLSEAAREFGYSADHVGRLVREGVLPNAGRRGAPRVTRGAMRNRPPRAGVDHGLPEPYDPLTDARELLGRQGER